MLDTINQSILFTRSFLNNSSTNLAFKTPLNCHLKVKKISQCKNLKFSLHHLCHCIWLPLPCLLMVSLSKRMPDWDVCLVPGVNSSSNALFLRIWRWSWWAWQRASKRICSTWLDRHSSYALLCLLVAIGQVEPQILLGFCWWRWRVSLREYRGNHWIDFRANWKGCPAMLQTKWPPFSHLFCLFSFTHLSTFIPNGIAKHCGVVVWADMRYAVIISAIKILCKTIATPAGAKTA